MKNKVKRMKIIRLILLILICVAIIFLIMQTFSESKEDKEDDVESSIQEVSYQAKNLKLLGLLEGVDQDYELEEYMTFLLKALGYTEDVDFTRETLREKAIAIHLIAKGEYDYFKEHDFLRGDRVSMSYRALFIKQKNSEETLIEKLEDEGKLQNNKWKDIGKSTIKEVLKYDEKQYGAYFEELDDIALEDKIYNRPSEEIPESHIENPLVLIHCSHQHEKFADGEGILVAAKKLYEQLNNLGIPTIIETRKVERVMDENPILLGEYYMATRSLIVQQRELNPTINYKIDLHVDRHERMHTIDYKGKQYAILMPVVGNGSANKEDVEEFANKVTHAINKEGIPTLAKEPYLYVRKRGVGGNFGQDLFDKAILIEVGTEYTDLKAAENSMEILAKAIKNIIKEDIHNKTR